MCNRRAFYKNWSHHNSTFNKHGAHPGRKFWKEKLQAAFSNPPANVKEQDDQYVLYLYAPGLEKSDFLIAIVDNNLSISVEREKEEDKTIWRRQEYFPSSFKRQFELNDKVDKTTISAKYERGVLKVILPKLEGFETRRQEVEIA